MTDAAHRLVWSLELGHRSSFHLCVLCVLPAEYLLRTTARERKKACGGQNSYVHMYSNVLCWWRKTANAIPHIPHLHSGTREPGACLDSCHSAAPDFCLNPTPVRAYLIPIILQFCPRERTQPPPFTDSAKWTPSQKRRFLSPKIVSRAKRQKGRANALLRIGRFSDQLQNPLLFHLRSRRHPNAPTHPAAINATHPGSGTAFTTKSSW
jgi:hypothetical protein